MSNKPSASKIDTVIKLILIFCITLLSFSLGTFVGKQVSDSEYKKAALEGEYKYFNAQNDEEMADEDELTKEDLESLTNEFVKSEKRDIASAQKDAKPADASKMKKKMEEPKTMKANSETLKKYVKTRPTQEKMPEMKKPEMARKMDSKTTKANLPAKRVAENKAPAKTPVKKRKPQSVLPSIANNAIGKYTVQVASYADEKEARLHSANLKEKGWNAFYVPADVRGRKWFRVSVGLFSTSSSAEKFKAELVKDNAVSSAYVQKIVR